MADRLKKGIAVRVTFVDGEEPTARKLNAITAQTDRALDLLEKAIGDYRGESHPYHPVINDELSLAYGRSTTSNAPVTGDVLTRPLDIATLARLIGPASNLNPSSLSLDQKIITEIVPSGVHEFTTRWPIKVSSLPNPLTFSDGTVFATVNENTPPTAPGEASFTWEGRINTYSPMAGGTVTYEVDFEAIANNSAYQGSTFNVIPDPNQLSAAGGLGCDLNTSSGTHVVVTLPLATHQQSSMWVDNSSLSFSDPNRDEQLTMPQVLAPYYNGSYSILPEGFVYLKDWDTGKVYDRAIYKAEDTDIHRVRIENIDIAEINDAISNGHKFAIVTVGTDITSSIDDLRKKSQHSHDRKFGEPLIEAEDIAGWAAEAPPTGTYGMLDPNIPGNYVVQALHRDGWQGDTPGVHDNNVMRGDLVLGYNEIWNGSSLDPAQPGEFGSANPESLSTSLFFGLPTYSSTPYIRKGFPLLRDDLYIIARESNIRVGSTYNAPAFGYTNNNFIVDSGLLVNASVRCLDDTRVNYQNTVMAIANLPSPGGAAGTRGGNIVNETGNILVQGAVLGPTGERWDDESVKLNRWEIDGDPSISDPDTKSNWIIKDTPSSTLPSSLEWVVPKLGVIHYSGVLRYRGKDEVDEVVIGSGDQQNIRTWDVNVPLPNFLNDSGHGGNAIIGLLVAIRPRGTTSSESNSHMSWFTTGYDSLRPGSFALPQKDSMGVRISACWNIVVPTVSGSSLSNTGDIGYHGISNCVYIRIGADGFDGSGAPALPLVNPFHHEYLEIDHSFAGWTTELDTKITLLVAMPEPFATGAGRRTDWNFGDW